MALEERGEGFEADTPRFGGGRCQAPEVAYSWPWWVALDLEE